MDLGWDLALVGELSCYLWRHYLFDTHKFEFLSFFVFCFSNTFSECPPWDLEKPPVLCCCGQGRSNAKRALTISSPWVCVEDRWLPLLLIDAYWLNICERNGRVALWSPVYISRKSYVHFWTASMDVRALGSASLRPHSPSRDHFPGSLMLSRACSIIPSFARVSAT